MEYILSKEQLTKARSREGFFSALNESIRARERGTSIGEITVFLSHNHNDKNTIYLYGTRKICI